MFDWPPRPATEPGHVAPLGLGDTLYFHGAHARYAPQPDITAYELAVLVRLFGAKQAGAASAWNVAAFVAWAERHGLDRHFVVVTA